MIGVYPLTRGLIYSLYDYNLLKPSKTHFVGLQNYVDLAFDDDMRGAFVNTAIFTAVGGDRSNC